MCVAAAAIPALTLAVSAVGTAASVGMGVYSAVQSANQAQAQLNYQAQAQQQQMELSRQQMVLQQDQQNQQLALQQKQNTEAQNLQIMQANAQIANQYNQARQQVLTERSTIMAKNAAERMTYQRSVETAQSQIANNNEATNRVYIAEQQKMTEARKKAAFEQQTILAKSIGNMGNVLAAGRTGASVGLLSMDVERQKGFALAQQSGTLDSQREASIIAMDSGWLQNQSANNQTLSNVGWNPTDPYMPEFPNNPQFVNGIGLQIDNLNRSA